MLLCRKMSSSVFDQFLEKAFGGDLKRVSNEKLIEQNILKLETDIEEDNRLTQLSIGKHAKQMAKMLESISWLEDEKMEQTKVLSGIDSEIKDLENNISSLRAKKVSIETTSQILDKQIEDSEEKKRTIENNFEMWHNERKMESEARIKKVKVLKEELNDSGSKQIQLQSDQFQGQEEVGSNAGKLKSLDFLTKLINRYTDNLECPICLNTAETPIYQCRDSHLICSRCRPKVEKCPECRISYKEEFKRHRSGLNLDFFKRREILLIWT